MLPLLCAALCHAVSVCRVGMLSVCIVLMMIASEFFLGQDKGLEGSGWPWWMHARWRVATAGAIASVASLVLLLMAVGTE